MIYVKEIAGNLLKLDTTEYREATAEDLARLDREEKRRAARQELMLVQRQLEESNAEAARFADGEISEAEFAPIQEHRQALKARLAELEAEQ